MTSNEYLSSEFPLLGEKLPRMTLASLPTPVAEAGIRTGSGERRLSIKYDNLTGSLYGGNKIRKLEYIFPLALAKGCQRIATFGAAGSNHALATALYAKQAGLECTCFLSHQAKTPFVPVTLNKHAEIGTTLIRFGGAYHTRVEILRKNLWEKHAWVIPMGGSSWLGTVGFVAAGLELAAQISDGEVVNPDRIYVGSGTMGTAAGIALGLALAGIETEVHAVRVSDKSITNRVALQRLLEKTVYMMHRLDNTVPADTGTRCNIILRDEFFGPGYAQSTQENEAAIKIAREQLDLTLEPTYTGKAMAAVLADLDHSDALRRNVLYWHTYNSVPLNTPSAMPLNEKRLPRDFLRYFDQAQTPESELADRSDLLL